MQTDYKKNPMIGGPGIVVKIDEAVFTIVIITCTFLGLGMNSTSC
jgi:hypothetical protein